MLVECDKPFTAREGQAKRALDIAMFMFVDASFVFYSTAKKHRVSVSSASGFLNVCTRWKEVASLQLGPPLHLYIGGCLGASSCLDDLEKSDMYFFAGNRTKFLRLTART
jgi:hypothetical protein